MAMAIPATSFTLVKLRARGLHFLRRHLAVLLEERGELLGAVAHWLKAEVVEVLLPELRRVDDLRRFSGELHYHVARRARGRGEAEVERGVEVGETRFGEGRHLGYEGVTRLARRGERLHLARLQMRRGTADDGEHHIEPVGHDVLQPLH